MKHNDSYINAIQIHLPFLKSFAVKTFSHKTQKAEENVSGA